MTAERNLARYLSFNVVRLAGRVVADFPRSGADLDRLVRRLQAEARGDDLTRAQKRALLYGEDSLDALPLAVLDARYLPLSDDRLPQSVEELTALCRWLMSRSGEAALSDTFVRGWAEGATPHDTLAAFTKRLWAARGDHPGFFAAVVTGRHHQALSAIVNGQVAGLGDEAAIWLLTRMALIWAGFDCQATTARVRRSMTRPLGWLIRGEGQRIKSATLLAVLRPMAALTDTLLASYRFASDDDDTPRFRSRRFEVVDIGQRAGPLAADLERRRGTFALDEIVCAVRARWTNMADMFVRQAQQTRTDAAFRQRQACELWYAGLSPLEAVGLVAIRLAQMEQVLEGSIRQAVEVARLRQRVPSLIVPNFCPDALREGWKGRTRSIVDALRVAILKDPDLHTVRRSRVHVTGAGNMLEGAANDDRYIAAVTTFLARTGRYGPITKQESWRERRRAFEDLDLAVRRRSKAIV